MRALFRTKFNVVSLMAQTTYKVDLAPFPKPEKGQKQVVIEVPHSQNDGNKKIEIFVGKPWKQMVVIKPS